VQVNANSVLKILAFALNAILKKIMNTMQLYPADVPVNRDLPIVMVSVSHVAQVV
jgi:hypothetical protein